MPCVLVPPKSISASGSIWSQKFLSCGGSTSATECQDRLCAVLCWVLQRKRCDMLETLPSVGDCSSGLYAEGKGSAITSGIWPVSQIPRAADASQGSGCAPASQHTWIWIKGELLGSGAREEKRSDLFCISFSSSGLLHETQFT